MSLTPCRFFAQGHCRFGNSCRFYHGGPAGGGMGTGNFFGNRTLAPATFQAQQHQQPQSVVQPLNLGVKSNQNLDIIMETVKKDMQEWTSSGIWPYSCYGPVGGKPSVPGFEDLSPEEHRYNYMLHSGNLPPQIPLQFQNTLQLRQSYQQPTMDHRNTIERIATATTGPITTQPGSAASIFGGGAAQQPQAASIFGGGATTAAVPAGGSLFGGTAATTTATGSIFGGGAGTGNLFGGTQQTAAQKPTSLFGGASTFGQQPAAGGIFGGGGAATTTTAAAGGLFSQQPQQQSLFGQTATTPAGGLFSQPQQQQSLFGGQVQTTPQQQQQPGSLFQQPQQQQQPPGGLFAQPQQPQQATGGLFQGAPQQQPHQQSSIFGGAGGAGGGSIFGGGGTTSAPSLFGAPTQTPSIFGGPTGNSPLAQGQQQLQQQQPSGQPVTQAVLAAAGQQKGVYTEETELTPEELEAFRADQFTVDNLPTRPPPQSLCF